jgi:4-amino-4-deoxy-L-arabinose transferase-like glycosyltransferase
MHLSKRIFLALLLLEVLVNFSGIAVPFFSNDPALYASVSKTMVQRNDFIDLYVYGVDWLDKPHFPFWMAAFSFKLFGISEWSYRLPALLFILLGAFYTFRLAKKLYNTDVAQIAVLVVLSAQHLLMSNTDIRAEPYLFGLIIGAIYHFYCLFQRLSFVDLLLGSLFAGCAVMTKGIFALVPIGTAILGHSIFTSQFQRLFRWRWLLAIIATVIFILPEVYAVYVQFDKHPEKIVFGSETGVSGVKWFLWDSQFSRFVNNGPITRPKGDLFYYVHTLLWAYAPWCLLFYFVFAKRMIAFIKRKKLQEYITISAIIPMLLFFSLSKFQLNFYTNILFPFFSILVASFIASVLSRGEKRFYSISQLLYSSLFIIAVVVINILFKPQYQLLYFIGAALLVLAAFFIWKSKVLINSKWLVISVWCVLFANLYLNFTVYPVMASLKGENQAAAFVNKFYPGQKLGVFENRRNGFEFYSDQPVQTVNLDQWLSGAERDRIFYVDHMLYAELISKNASFEILKEFPDYTPEGISGKFLNSSTRPESIRRCYLVRLQ